MASRFAHRPGAVLSATTVRAFRETYLMNIYVGNLAYGVTQDELREAFAAYGEVESANLITDKFTGESKGFGFVEMPNNSEADAAIKALNEQPLKGRPMRVNQAKPGSNRERPVRMAPNRPISLPGCWRYASATGEYFDKGPGASFGG
jgi:RNA recognition motif-containing protein